MNSLLRSLGVLLLLSFAGFAVFLSGCGSSNSSTPTNQALTVEGTWKVSASVTGGGSNGFTAGLVVLTPQSGNCVINALGLPFEVAGATTCFIADPGTSQGSISGVTGTWDYPPAGFMFELATTDPVAANTTSPMAGYFVETDGTNLEVLDLTGTITASTKTISGTFSCDAQSSNPCVLSGTFTAVHQ